MSEKHARSSIDVPRAGSARPTPSSGKVQSSSTMNAEKSTVLRRDAASPNNSDREQDRTSTTGHSGRPSGHASTLPHSRGSNADVHHSHNMLGDTNSQGSESTTIRDDSHSQSQNPPNELSESQQQAYQREVQQVEVKPIIITVEPPIKEGLLDIPAVRETPRKAYNFQRILGRGIFGEVFRCTVNTKDRYAVKTMKPASEIHMAVKQKFEIEILEEMSENPNRPGCIMKFIEAFWSSEDTEYPRNPQGVADHLGRRICIVCEYIEGPTLFQILHRKQAIRRRGTNIRDFPMKDPQDVKSVIRQILTGLVFLDDIDVVHRDIKPENILIVRQRRNKILVKIIDFGLAVRASSRGAHGIRAIAGSWPYFPPEIACGAIDDKIATCTMDIWALGVTFWEMIHGIDTFPIDVMTRHEAEREVVRKRGWDSKKRQEFFDNASTEDLNKLTRRVQHVQKLYNEHQFGKELKFDTKEWEKFKEGRFKSFYSLQDRANVCPYSYTFGQTFLREKL
ncbi:kinase-like protein [Fomitiporia mediterranea MF3/22]|uniref:kinase-like protein n=1 Tax=Fomitiporia mediterranea (strain MF3/22) TaxID=694068 RepID=UPI000440993B|nr:kinase-like protein [Fomitiporia mediterranea MF3/22]EJD04921.1 kinase-like protein [Fomitiporia mediterranea MF3/22]